jgi:hypothetical protein
VRLILQTDEWLSDLEHQTQTLHARCEEQSALRESLERRLQSQQDRLADLQERADRLERLESSRIWKIAAVYYRLRDGTPLRYLHRLLFPRKSEPAAGRAAAGRMAGADGTLNGSAADAKGTLSEDGAIVQAIMNTLNDRSLKGVVLITGSLVFDDPAVRWEKKFAEFLAAHGWGVMFAAWRRQEEGGIPSIGQEVRPNIFPISTGMLLEQTDILARTTCPRKILHIGFPHPAFFPCMLKLRRCGYRIGYDILEDWAEVRRAGTADWFVEPVEQAIVVNANDLTAVSRPLAEKFNLLRGDIRLLPAGSAAGESAWEQRASEMAQILEKEPWMSC